MRNTTFRQMKRVKTCIFCGRRGNLSKEHFWPEWLHPHLKPLDAVKHISEFQSAEGKVRPKLERRSERPGALQTKKIRAVCTGCNNGWMSQIEAAVKPSLLKLLLKSQNELLSDESAILAYWVALKTMVGEHASEDAALTPPMDRLQFYTDRTIPDYFRIYVATHTLQTSTAYARHATVIAASQNGPSPPLLSGISRNIQSVSFIVGRATFYVTAIREHGLPKSLLAPAYPMLCIWPHAKAEPKRIPELTPAQLSYISFALDRLVQHPLVSHGGPLAPNATGAT